MYFYLHKKVTLLNSEKRFHVYQTGNEELHEAFTLGIIHIRTNTYVFGCLKGPTKGMAL